MSFLGISVCESDFVDCIDIAVDTACHSLEFLFANLTAGDVSPLLARTCAVVCESERKTAKCEVEKRLFFLYATANVPFPRGLSVFASVNAGTTKHPHARNQTSPKKLIAKKQIATKFQKIYRAFGNEARDTYDKILTPVEYRVIRIRFG